MRLSGNVLWLLVLLVFLGALPLSAQAPLTAYPCRIVDYGSDVGTGYPRGVNMERLLNVDIDGDGQTAGESILYWPFSLTLPLNPSFPIYDTDAPSAVFYGGLMSFGKGNSGLQEGHMNQNHELRDDFNLMSQSWGTDKASRAYGLWCWAKDGFLNGGDAAKVTFDDRSKIAVHITRFFQGLDDARWVARDGEQFYLSKARFADETTFSSNNRKGTHTSHVVIPTQTEWAPYNPKEPYDLAFDAAKATFAPHTFTDVTAVGFYLARNQLTNGSMGIKWYAFEAYASVNRPQTAGLHLDMATIPAGKGHDAFYMSKTEVPYAVWQKVWKTFVSNQFCRDISAGYVFDRDGDMGSMKLGSFPHSAQEPVTDITWLDAVAWCNALSEYEGRTPCYYSDAEMTKVLRIVKERDDPKKWDVKPNVYVKWEADGYRLPTYAEWMAANGDAMPTPETAWTEANAEGRTHPVGTKQANANGLFDMQGNVWEYLWDAPAEGYINNRSHGLLGSSIFTFNTDYKRHEIAPLIGLRVVRRNVGGKVPDVQTGAGFLGFETVGPVGPREHSGEPKKISPLGPVEMKLIKLDQGDGKDGAFPRKDGALVRISPFYMNQTETTYTAWNAVYQWAVNNGYTFNADGDMGSMDHETAKHEHTPDEPVTDITWDDALVWCNALSEMTGRTPCYYTDAERTKVYRKSNPWRVATWQGVQYAPVDIATPTIYVRWSADGYRLPTQAEWQFAYRDGKQAKDLTYPWGKAADAVKYGWLAPEALGTTKPVAQKEANGYGLYDLVGNVSEFVWDWPGTDYYRTTNPKGSDNRDMFGKAIQGSNFGHPAEPNNVATTMTLQEYPGVPRPIFGFRVVRRDTDVHPRDDTFVPATVLEFDPKTFDPLQGRVHRANLSRDGNFKATGVPAFTKVKWTCKTGGKVRSSPVVVDGVCYIGSDDKNVYALDANTGEQRWKYTTGGPIISSAAVVVGTVYIGSGDSYLYALDAKTGELQWKFARMKMPVTTAPAVAYGVVFSAFGLWNGNGITGVDAKTGKEVWRFRSSYNNDGPYGPATDGVKIYAPYGDIHLIAADLRSEYPAFDAPGNACAGSTPLHGDLVFYQLDDRMTAYNKTTGARVWQYYFGKWNQDIDRDPTASPAIDDTRVYCGWKTNFVSAHDLKDGKKFWEFTVDGPIFSAPAVANGSLYVGSDDGHLYVLDTATGQLRWKYKTGDRLRASPWVADGVVYFASDDGNVYAVE